MPAGLRIEWKLEGGDVFAEAGERAMNCAPFLTACGMLLLASASRRLDTVLKHGDVVRSGTLEKSLQATGPGTGTPHTIFNVSEWEVYFGSSVPYAAQVNYGGTIYPDERDALAIPLTTELKRYGIGPLELDPTREVLKFVPTQKGKPNVIGVLVDEEGLLGKGTGPLYALAYLVRQEPRPFLYIDEEDVAEIQELWAVHLEGN
ncbi:hypothetical protein AMJ85_05295 [candidate division BRC1 bacterium SM23_51]|nr:MAG: hypothetical protein AMJ85_05295 [candidate division BRC1 bacterium SM23_51]